MRDGEHIEGYLQAVQEQIRWRRVRPAISRELRQHLEDQQGALLREGKPPEEAERLAVAEMGDPVAVGMELDRLHRPKAQAGPLALTLLLALAGGLLRVLLTAKSTSPNSPLHTLLALLMGTACLLGGYFLDYSRLFCYPRTLYVSALGGSLLLCFLPFFSYQFYGKLYYIGYLVLLYPTAYAIWLCAFRGKGWWGLAAAITGGIPLTLLCLYVPSLRAAGTLLITGFILLLCAIRAGWFSVPPKKAVAAVCLLALGAVLLAFLFLLGSPSRASYLLIRLQGFYHPEQDPMGRGYMLLSIRRALAASRWLGPGNALPAPLEQFVPEWQSDALLATLIYKLGWLPFLLLVLAAAGLMLWLLLKCLRLKNQAGRLLSLSVVLPLMLQAAVSLLLNLGVLSLSAEFPLIIGNLHTMIDMGLIGLALSAFRGSSLPEGAATQAAESARFSRLWRSLGIRPRASMLIPIQNLMETMGLSGEQAMAALKIPEAEREKYHQLLGK